MADQSTIQVFYKCTCDPKERTITVIARREGEDIKAWMDKMAVVISKDHGFRSPRCPSRKMQYVKIPVSESGSAIIGAPVPPKAVQ